MGDQFQRGATRDGHESRQGKRAAGIARDGWPGWGGACICALTLLAVLIAIERASAETYRVGPGGGYPRISDIAGRLVGGDVVEITADMDDDAVINTLATASKPLIIRGITGSSEGRITRPELRPRSPEGAQYTLKISGSYVTLEGLAFTGFRGRDYGKAALVLEGRNMTLRNCYWHHNTRAVTTDPTCAGNTLVEFCEFAFDGAGQLSPYSFMSAVPGALLTVQHCYLHTNAGGNLLRVGYARNVIRYNWFEDQRYFAVQITTPDLFGEGKDPGAADRLLPTHSDIVGNVFASGWGSNAYGALELGGAGPSSPGTEGTFNIAHNLFIGRRGAYDPAVPYIAVVTHGNVDRIRLFNNVILDCRCGGCKVYERDLTWDTERSRVFASKHGGSVPLVAGANNWISECAYGLPDGLSGTLRGTVPGFCDLTGYDFHPAPGSPLEAKGLVPLPEGQAASLVPEFEPQRLVPPDLKPPRRRKVPTPSLGPFEVAESKLPFVDDTEGLVLGIRGGNCDVQWELGFGRAHRMALESLASGEFDRALQYAKMEFVLSPPEEGATNVAVRTACRALRAKYGNDTRGTAFEEYTRYGPVGRDGVPGTGDDLADPLADVRLTLFGKSPEKYAASDRALDAKGAVEPEGMHYAYWWGMKWLAVEKVFDRIEGARFDEALDMLLPIIREAADKGQSAKPGDGGGTRQANLLDRIHEALIAIVRGRSGSGAMVCETAEQYIDAVYNGVAGKDALFGTDDDLGVGFGVADFGKLRLSSGGGTLDSSAQAARDRGPAEGVARRVEAVRGLQDRAGQKIAYIVRNGHHGPVWHHLCQLPTPGEFFELASARMAGCGPAPDAKALSTAAALELTSFDKAVLRCYADAVKGADVDVRAHLRGYVTAYLLGAHSDTGYRDAFPLFRGGLAAGDRPLCLVQDAMNELGDPFLACDVLDALCACDEIDPNAGETATLLAEIEERQYQAVDSICLRTGDMPQDSQAPLLQRGLSYCKKYLARFAAGRYVSLLHCPMAILRYRLHDYDEAVKEATEFVALNTDSPSVPNVLLIRAAALVEAGKEDAAIEQLRDIVARLDATAVAPEALFLLGRTYAGRGDYNEARDALQRCVDLYPASPRAQDAKDILTRLPAPTKGASRRSSGAT